MVKKRGLVIATFLLLGIFLSSSLVFAYGTTFDSATEIKNKDVITETLRAGENHFYTYYANYGDDVEIILEHEKVKTDIYNNEKYCGTSRSNLCYSNTHISFQPYNTKKEKNTIETSRFYDESGEEDAPIIWKFDSKVDGFRWLSIFIDKEVSPKIDYTLRVSIKCKEGYTAKFKKCVNGEWIYDQVTDAETGQTISAEMCQGCIWNNKCYAPGKTFMGLDNINRYCDESTKQVIEQKRAGASCKFSYECASHLTCAEGKCYDLREVKDKETGNTIYSKDCKTNCIVDEICYAVGNRFKDGNQTASYCSVGKTIEPQKEEEKLCSENYECFSNECSKGVCIDTIGFIQSIVNWIKSLFGLN
jgi:hypothetical protein